MSPHPDPDRLPVPRHASGRRPGPRAPDFLVVGAQRSGTSSLARYLGSHPGLFLADGKEIHFFDRHFERGSDWYFERFSDAGPRIAFEATPDYMYMPGVIERIERAIGPVPCVAILRDPVDRAYSQYWHTRSRGLETLGFEEAIGSEARRLADGDPIAVEWFSYTERGRYLAQLARISERFGRDHVSVVLFEDLRDEPVATIRGILRSLGVDDGVISEVVGRRTNPAVRYRSQRVRRLAMRLPPRLRRLVDRTNARVGQIAPLSQEMRARLAAAFAEDNQRLADWLGRDLPWTGAAMSRDQAPPIIGGGGARPGQSP